MSNPTHKGRRIVRALPSPALAAMAGLAVAYLVTQSHLLAGIAIAYAVYVAVTGEVEAVLDPECRVPEHQHDDCPACGDLPPLVPVRRVLQRFGGRAAR